MLYSYSQLSHYLRCPRSYRYRYLDGWQEKDTRAAMIFGRCFEKALGGYFSGEDSTAVLFKEWGVYQDAPLDYRQGDSWGRMVHEGVHLLHKLAQDDRVHVPSNNLQRKMTRQLSNGNEFVAYIDAIGEIDGKEYLIDWKTTTSRYAEEPQGLLSLDPQLICYSWISGIRDVALVVFVRKRYPEIQYLKTSISPEQQKEFSQLVDTATRQIEGAEFLPHSGIRFPMNGCTSCCHLGLCLENQALVGANLERRAGASELDWLDQFEE